MQARDPLFYLASPQDALLRRQIYGAPYSFILNHFREWSPVDGLIIQRKTVVAAGMSEKRFFGNTDFDWMRFGVQRPDAKDKGKVLSVIAEHSKTIH